MFDRTVELVYELMQPVCLSDVMGNGFVLSLGARTRGGELSLRGPRDEVVT